MSDEVLQALISAGIPTPAALRVAAALRQAYLPISPASPENVQLRSAVVENSAVVGGSLSVGADIACNNLTVRNNAAILGDLSSVKASIGNLSVLGSAYLGPGNASFAAPIVANEGLVCSRGAQLVGTNVLAGQISLQGAVDWNGPRSPAQIEVLSFLNANGGNAFQVWRNQVAVLNDYGKAPGTVTIEADIDGSATVLTGAANAVSFNSITAATLNATTAAASVYVITKVGFDAINCGVTSSGTYIQNVTSIGGTISLGTEAKTAIATAGTTTINRIKTPGIKITAT